jgi:hypothetical protein
MCVGVGQDLHYLLEDALIPRAAEEGGGYTLSYKFLRSVESWQVGGCPAHDGSLAACCVCG